MIYEADDDVKDTILQNAQYYQNTTKGASPLYWAARLGHKKLVHNLISKGVKPDIKTDYGETPLLTAAKYGQPDVVRILLATTVGRLSLSTPESEKGYTPLHVAVRNNHSEIVRILLDCDEINVNERSKDGWSPLHIAALRGNSDILEMLLRGNANVNISANSGITALHIAVWKNYSDIMKMLLRKSFNMNPIPQKVFQSYLTLVCVPRMKHIFSTHYHICAIRSLKSAHGFLFDFPYPWPPFSGSLILRS